MKNKVSILTQVEMDRIRTAILAQCEVVGDCWVYRGSLNAGGYGIKRVGGRLHAVSRILLAFQTGQSLNCRFDACHDTTMCPYKACCNPDHLVWASHADNCRQREQATREMKRVLRYWESHAWINGRFRKGLYDSSIDHCFTRAAATTDSCVLHGQQPQLIDMPLTPCIPTDIAIPY